MSELEEDAPLLNEDEFETKVKEWSAKRNKNSVNYSGLFSSLFFYVVLIGIGLPIWWRTTTPERWPLPEVTSLMVRSQTLTHLYQISVVFLESNNAEAEVLRTMLQGNYPRRNSLDNSLAFVHEWTVRAAFPIETTIFNQAKEIEDSSKLISILDEKYSSPQVQKRNSILFYILPISVKTEKLVHQGRYRAFYLDLNHLTEADYLATLSEEIFSHVTAVESLVERVYSGTGNEQNLILLLARQFDLIFNIIYEDDQLGLNFDIRTERHSNLTRAIDSITSDFYTTKLGFSQYFWIQFVSQVLHYVFPNNQFLDSKIQSSSEKERFLPVTEVDSILNRIEASRVEKGNDKSYHLVLLVGSASRAPLRFKDGTSTANLITTPFRGSILIVNNEDDLVEGFRQLMRIFFRLPPRATLPDGQYFTQLELESVVHALVQKHILLTLNSLESTEKLVRKVSNMVIEKKIAERMHESVERSMEAAHWMSDMGDIKSAYEQSWTAYWLSEKAFFDPSLLAMLYFPDDQKYAIYLPLFLPIAIPLLVNLRYIVPFLWRAFNQRGN